MLWLLLGREQASPGPQSWATSLLGLRAANRGNKKETTRSEARQLLPAPGRPSACPAACDRRALRCRFFAAGEADVSTFYIVLAGRVALACPAAAEEQSQAPAAGSPARLRDRGQSSHLRKTLSRPEACAESGKGRPQIPEEVIAELGAGDSFGEEAIFSLGEADRDIAEATDTICALDYTNRKYSAWRLSRDLEFLAVRDEEVLASLLQVYTVTGVCLGPDACPRLSNSEEHRLCARVRAIYIFANIFAL